MARKKELTADDIIRQMYPDLKTSDDYAAEAEAAKKAATGGDNDPSKELQALRTQIASLEGQLSTVTRPVARQTTMQAPQPPVIDWDKAPDPVEDPKGYARFVHNSTQAQINYEKEAWNYNNQVATTQSRKVDGLWEQFGKDYPSYAKRTEHVEIAASRVLEKAKAQGLDTENYMYGQSAKFLKDVTAEVDRLFGKAATAGADEDNDDDDDDDDRSQVFGGGAAGVAGLAKVTQPAEPYGAMSRDILAWQEKTGFHR